MDRQPFAVVGHCRSRGNDSLSTRSRGIPRRRISPDGQMKKKHVLALLLTAIVLIVTARYLCCPGAVPIGQQPLVSLSLQNFSEFDIAFDDHPDVPGLVLLLSPTC